MDEVPSDSLPLTAPPDVLSSFGKLREALVALRNLEQLLSSVQVGPKILAHVLPELQQSSTTWLSDARALVAYCGRALGSTERLHGFEGFVADLLQDFSRSLTAAHLPTMSAKARLSLERDVRRLVPAIGAAIDHLELLVEATWARGLPLSLKELLLSSPDNVGERPYRPLRIVGDAELVEVTLPARVALRALGALIGLAESDAGLRVTPGDGTCALSVERVSGETVLAQLPIMTTLRDTQAVVQSSLARYGVTISADGRSITLPSRPVR